MISLHNLTKSYGNNIILENTNYHFPKTGLVCLQGESGCGKTSLMNLIAGLDDEFTGEIIVENVSLSSLSKTELCNYRKDYIGFVFQDYLLFSGYTVMENILYPCVLKNTTLEQNTHQAKVILKDFEMLEKADEKVQNLSGGQKQRVAIARALIKNPKIIIADEPTGALDRKTAMGIMDILKEISSTKLVIVITHDPHLRQYADECISIKNQHIFIEQALKEDREKNSDMVLTPPQDFRCCKLAYKNFKISFIKYMFIACIISIGIFCVLISLSSKNMIEGSIQSFKDKNVTFNNGYIKNDGSKDVYHILANNAQIENVYKQYTIQNVSLSMNSQTEIMHEKYPMPKTKESISYGRMPKNKVREIALTPSLAKKFNNKIKDIIGMSILLEHNSHSYVLTVCGIYNAGYDDFFVSSDVEKLLYQDKQNDPYYSISYDVKNFEDIVTFHEELAKDHIQSENAVEQVRTLQTSFSKIRILFLMITGMIFLGSLFLVITIFIKLQSVRYKMVGLLYSFGFQKRSISKIIIIENIILIILVVLITSILFIGAQWIMIANQFLIRLNIKEAIITLAISCTIILAFTYLLNKKLLYTRPTVSLKK